MGTDILSARMSPLFVRQHLLVEISYRRSMLSGAGISRSAFGKLLYGPLVQGSSVWLQLP